MAQIFIAFHSFEKDGFPSFADCDLLANMLEFLGDDLSVIKFSFGFVIDK